MTYRVEAVIIGKTDLREADRIYTLYTKELGKISVVAQAVKKISSKLAGHLEVATLGSFVIAKGKTIDRIATIDVRDHFTCIHGDLDRLASALYCLEVVDTMVKEAEPDPALFVLMTDFLAKLNTALDRRPTDVAQDFLAALLLILGYHPDEEADMQKVLTMHLDRPVRSQAFFDFLLGVR